MFSQTVKRFYDPTFTISPEYKESLPDLQNGSAQAHSSPGRQGDIGGFGTADAAQEG